MSKREEVKDLERAAFATAYVENGFNGKQAALAIKPNLTEHGAEVCATRALSDERVLEKVSAITEQTRQVVFDAIAFAVKSLRENEIESDNPELRAMGHKYLNEYGKIFSPDSKTPKTAIQKNNYNFPSKNKG